MFPFYNNTFTLLILFTVFLITSACSRAVESDSLTSEYGNAFTIWALADIQPRNENDRKSFANAIDDVNSATKNVEMAIVAGDIASRPSAEVYQWYKKTRNGSYIDQWYEILGNHDLKNDEGRIFRDILKVESNYKLLRGNLLFIFLSDTEGGKPTEIGNETFEWWKELVINNQDKIIIVVTHAPLEGSSIAFSSLDDRQIVDSKRFSDVLKDYSVDLWLSGHLHLPNSFTNTIVKKEDFSETVFVHISSIRTELFGLKNSESRFISFYCDSNRIGIHSRDHDSREWDTELSREFKLSKIVKCEAKNN